MTTTRVPPCESPLPLHGNPEGPDHKEKKCFLNLGKDVGNETSRRKGMETVQSKRAANF